MAEPQKTWWAPVWRGLVVDPKGKHYRRMGVSLWLHLYLILHADRATGRLPCKLATIARATGIPRRNLQRWMSQLRREGYISIEQTGRAAWISIRRWKALVKTSKVTPLPRQLWHPSYAKSVIRRWPGGNAKP